jgi:hypothetical protein
MYAYMLWADTTAGIMKMRNGANSAWISLWELDGTFIASDISLAAGSAAAPSLFFTGDTNTGIYSPGADQVAISTGGTGRLFASATGNISIGTTTSGTVSKLMIKQASDTNYAGLWLESNTDDSGIGLYYNPASNCFVVSPSYGTLGAYKGLAFYTSNLERARIDTSGRLGIGTSSVSALLHAKGAGGSTSGSELLRLETTQATGGNWISFTDASARKGYIGYKETTDDNLYIANEESGHVVIPGTTRLGIGTTAPSQLLEIKGANARFAVNSTTVADGGILLQGNGTTYAEIKLDASSGILDIAEKQAAGNITFSIGTTPTERARLTSDGKFLVGTSTSPAAGGGQYARIVIQGYTGGAGGAGDFSIQRGELAAATPINSGIGVIRFNGSDGYTFGQIECIADANAGASSYPGRLTFSTTANGASSPTERMRIGNAGGTFFYMNSGWSIVGSSAATAGTATAIFNGRYGATGVDTGTNSFYVWSNGNVVNTNNSYGAISDVKLKENILDANSQWDDLKGLRVVNYNFKEGQTHTQIGLVAQEAELVSPGLVSESPDRDEEGNDLGTVTKSINYSVLYMKAVKALQEAMERIETLEARLTAAGIE